MTDWNPEPIRDAIRQFIARRDLKVQPWAKRAGVSEGSLRNFLAGHSNAMSIETLGRLADAEGVTIAELTGEDRDERGSINVERLQHAIAGVIEISRDADPARVAETIATVYAAAPHANTVQRTPELDYFIRRAVRRHDE